MKRKLLTVMLAGVLSMGLMVGCGEDTNVKPEETSTQSETIESKVESEETEESSETETEQTEESTSTSVPESKDEPKESKTEESKPTEPPHEHNYSSSISKNATCAESGTKIFKCSCGDSYTETIAKTGHNWNGGEYVQNGTCSSEAVKRFTCSVCGATEDRGTGEFGSHNFQTFTTEDKGHYETKRVFKCGCGAKFYDSSSAYAHQDETGHSGSSLGEESTWIVDEEGTSYSQCTICGARQ